MKFLFTGMAFLLTFIAKAQYYYKDILTTKEINATYAAFKKAKVSEVKLNSYIGERQVTEGFDCSQQVLPAQNKVITHTKTIDSDESWLTAVYNVKDQIIKSIDSSARVVNTTYYEYDNNGLLKSMNNTSVSKQLTSSEKHSWTYNAKGNPVSMLKIRNNTDTTFVTFVLDEKGNVTEERQKRTGNAFPIPPRYYYYDSNNRLTDIARYNVKADRLLPDYMFEYEDNNELSILTIVPEGTDDYMKWYYKYNEYGLKDVEFCFNKRDQLQGKVTYEYKYIK